MNYTYSFEKLEIWQKSMDLTISIYQLTNSFPDSEKFGLTNQIRRAAASVSANIAEGSTKISNKEKSRYMQIAYGSLIEVLNHLILSQKINLISENILFEKRKIIQELSNKINAFNSSLIKVK